MVDKNLFLYNLAIVAILKNEGSYLKEWLNYHLAAGVEHFYLYDNDSTDNQAEVARPYVRAGIVDYFPAPGELMQIPVYNDAVKKFKFVCRNMAFIDADEFLYPKTNRSVAEVVDEILSDKPNAAGVAVNWQIYGSNGHESADLSRGVLERFTRRAPKNFSVQLPSGLTGGNVHVKTLANPRKINFVGNPHFLVYFESCHSVNENGNPVQGYNNYPVTAEKIVVNHYYTKSREEFTLKQNRGRSDAVSKYGNDWFDVYDRNEIFDDGILRYRAARAKNFTLENNDDRVIRVINTLTATLPTVSDMETALTCRAISSYLSKKLSDDRFKIFEEASLAAVLNLLDDVDFMEAQILIRALPELLTLPYPIVADIRRTTLNIVPQLKRVFRFNNLWRDYSELDYIQDLLKE
ncbi:MAG: glycosyltransferase family 92 protein [Quinella sp. 1Q7]|nr:glycosyltransferase family 92 protein [Quinella sp. 1Q7]